MADDVHSRFSVVLESALGEVKVLSMEGREELSRPFEFVFRLETQDEIPLAFEDFAELIAEPLSFAFGPDRDHPRYGVVREIRMPPVAGTGGAGRGGHIYEVVVEPRFSRTKLTRGSWIYQDQTVEDTITASFGRCGDAALNAGDDFEFALSGTYNPREYVVQYEESVFAFVSRQAEHWGYFYYIDHLGGVDKLVFGDTNAAFPQLEGFEEIRYEARAGVVAAEAIRSIGVSQTLVEKEVSLREHNYRIPSVELVTGVQQIDPAGVGSVHVSGDHFWLPDEGTMLARIRAEEMLVRKQQIQVHSNVRGLCAGHRFTLSGNEPELYGLAREYIVLSIRHHYHTDGQTDALGPYSNELVLIPAEVTFRPARTTPRALIHGFTHAKIDAEAADEFAVPCDEWGRYKVVMPWDVGGEEGGKASCWIRMATPAGGSGWGFSQGLHAGVEVAIYHLNGDPDRPVIAGAIPNFEQPPTVRQENAQQNVSSSRHGISITMSDA